MRKTQSAVLYHPGGHWPLIHGPVHMDALTDRDPRFPVYIIAEPPLTHGGRK